MFHSFFVLKQGLYTDPSFRFLSVLLCGQLERQSPPFNRFSLYFFFFFFFWLSLGLVVWPRLDDLFVSQIPRVLCVSFSRTDPELFLLLYSNFKFLHYCQCITFPTQSCLRLYSLCANLHNSYFHGLESSILLQCQNFFCILSFLKSGINKFPDFFRMCTFIDSTHMKL